MGMLTDAAFNKLLDGEVRSTLAMVQDHPQDLAPHLLVLYTDATDPSGKLRANVFCVFGGFPKDKYGLMKEMAVTFLGRNPQAVLQAVFLATEAWVSQQSEVHPSEDPKRREAIVINGITVDERHNMATVEIDRDEQGGIVHGEISTTHYVPDNSFVISHLLQHFARALRALQAQKQEKLPILH